MTWRDLLLPQIDQAAGGQLQPLLGGELPEAACASQRSDAWRIPAPSIRSTQRDPLHSSQSGEGFDDAGGKDLVGSPAHPLPSTGKAHRKSFCGRPFRSEGVTVLRDEIF